MHLETLKKVGAVEFVNPLGKTKEPDLAGLSINHQWHIMEAKGMTSNKLNSKIEEAKHDTLTGEKFTAKLQQQSVHVQHFSEMIELHHYYKIQSQ